MEEWRDIGKDGKKKCDPEVILVEKDFRQSLVQPPYTGGGTENNWFSVLPFSPEVWFVAPCLHLWLCQNRTCEERKDVLVQPLKHKMMGRKEEPQKPARGRIHEGGGGGCVCEQNWWGRWN